jgi:hypothetical protein
MRLLPPAMIPPMRRMGAAVGVLAAALAAAAAALAGGRSVHASEVPMAAGRTHTHFPALYSVACPPSGACVAAGSDYARAGPAREVAVAASAAGASWHAARQLTAPAGARPAGPAAGWLVTCPPGGACVAFGNYTTSAGTLLMQSVRRAGSWGPATRVALPRATGTGLRRPVDFGGIWCSAPGECVATLLYGPAGPSRAEVVTEHGGAWREATTIALPPGADPRNGAVLRGIACTGPGECVAVGQLASGAHGVAVPVMATEHGGRWSRAVAVAPPPGTSEQDPYGGSYLRAVVCPAAGSCTALGGYRDAAFNSRPFTLAQTHGAWGRATPMPLPRDSLPLARRFGIAEAYGIACTRPGACAVVGTYTLPSRDSVPLIETETGGRWSAGTRVALPGDAVPASGGRQTLLLAVAADGGGYVSVGFYNAGHGGTAAMAVRF